MQCLLLETERNRTVLDVDSLQYMFAKNVYSYILNLKRELFFPRKNFTSFTLYLKLKGRMLKFQYNLYCTLVVVLISEWRCLSYTMEEIAQSMLRMCNAHHNQPNYVLFLNACRCAHFSYCKHTITSMIQDLKWKKNRWRWLYGVSLIINCIYRNRSNNNSSSILYLTVISMGSH
jgi:hypothetical protein